eukprot:GFYU01016485.1.p1 GENE.GFYU01016485.1~~GFYU01016485.1.p1  ORF type:complete len:490 (-),score=136.94 GFYU01016485.1:51-1520(-)
MFQPRTPVWGVFVIVATLLLVSTGVHAKIKKSTGKNPYTIEGQNYHVAPLAAKAVVIDATNDDSPARCVGGHYLSDYCVFKDLVMVGGKFFLSKAQYDAAEPLMKNGGLWPSMSGNLTYVQHEYTVSTVGEPLSERPRALPFKVDAMTSAVESAPCDETIAAPSYLFAMKHRYNYHHFLLETLVPLYQTMVETGTVRLDEVEASGAVSGVNRNVRLFDLGPHFDAGYLKLLGAFSDHPLQNTDKLPPNYKVCMKSAVVGLSDKLSGAEAVDLKEFKEDPRTEQFQTFAKVVLAHFTKQKPEMPTEPKVTILNRRKNRKILNDKDVLKVFTNKGLNAEIVYTEDLSLDQQMKVFGSTTILVGMHGAGFINMIYLPPKASIIHLWPYKTSKITDTQERVAKILDLPFFEWDNQDIKTSFMEQGGQHYPFADIDPTDQKNILQSRTFALNQDTKVDLKVLKRLMDKAVKAGINKGLKINKSKGAKKGKKDEL